MLSRMKTSRDLRRHMRQAAPAGNFGIKRRCALLRHRTVQGVTGRRPAYHRSHKSCRCLNSRGAVKGWGMEAYASVEYFWWYPGIYHRRSLHVSALTQASAHPQLSQTHPLSPRLTVSCIMRPASCCLDVSTPIHHPRFPLPPPSVLPPTYCSTTWGWRIPRGCFHPRRIFWRLNPAPVYRR